MRIRRYIQGHRRGREANRIEREAMRDPFLADALEGYERSKEDPIPHVDILRRKIRYRNQRRLDVFKYGGIAASLLFILGFGIYFGFHNSELDKEIQSVEMLQAESLSAPVIGFDAYKKYVEEKMIRPIDDCKEIKGKVILTFHIDASGKPYDIKVIQSLCPSNDQEAIRLIKEGTLWTPTDQEVSYTIDF